MASLSEILEEKRKCKRRKKKKVNENVENIELTESEVDEIYEEIKEGLIEELYQIIDLIENDEITDEDLDILDEAIEELAEVKEIEDTEEEQLDEVKIKHMTSAERLAAKKRRRGAKYKQAQRRKKICIKRLRKQGKTEMYSCNSKGKAHKKDLRRSRLMKRIAKLRRKSR